MVDKKVPELRFDGFDGDWEQRKFEELLNKKDGVRRGPFGSALKKEIFVPKSDYVVYEQQNAIYDNYETRYNITESKFRELSKFSLTEGDFIMSGAGTIGRISRVPIGIKQGVFNQALIRFKINTEVTDSEYFIQFVRADNMQRKLTGANPGSAITNLVPMSEVKKWDILVPSKREQQEIGAFFKQLDDTITLHQRKLDQLKRLKQGFLQILFANKEQAPKVRFAGFYQEWEQRKLGDFSKTTFGGGTPKTSVSGYWNGEIPWIQSSNLTVGDVQNVRLDKFINEEGIKNSATKLVPANSIAIVTRVGVGKLALMKQEFATSQDFLSLSDLDVDEQFGLYSIYELLQKELNNIQGTSIKGMTKTDLLTKTIMIPVDKEEQAEIGAFFKNLDSLISIHQKKLINLKQLKKAFLQSMFI